MAKEFTPGPWGFGPTFAVETKSGIIIAVSVGGATKAERNANARLIAAAPDMYDFIKEFAEVFEGTPFEARAAKALLAKINGGPK